VKGCFKIFRISWKRGKSSCKNRAPSNSEELKKRAKKGGARD